MNPTRGELWGAGRITNFKLQLKVNGVYIQPTNVQLTNKPLSLTEVDPNWVPYTNKITRTNPVNSVRYDNQGAYISNVVYDKMSDTDMEVSARCVAYACALRALLLPAAAAGRRRLPSTFPAALVDAFALDGSADGAVAVVAVLAEIDFSRTIATAVAATMHGC